MIKKTKDKKTNKTTDKKVKRKLNVKKILVVVISAIAIISCLGCLGGGIIAYKMVSAAPEVKIENFESPESSKILDKDGNVIAEIGSQIRTNITYEDLPQSLIDAFVSVEDSRFFEHNGFDISRFVKAMFENLAASLKAGRIVFAQGGSTLTMQLIDNSYFMSDTGQQATNGITQKVQEIYMSMTLEPQTNKKRILEYYLNKVNFGGSGNIRGVQKAAEYYFGKDVNELTLSESAMLAGIVNAPNRYNPLKNLDLATQRRNTVLNLMLRHGYITKEECELAKSINVEDLLVDASSSNRGAGNGTAYQSYIDVVIEEVKDLTGKDPTVVPMTIYTCMDKDVQATFDAIQAGEVEGIEFPDDEMEIAIVSLNNHTGEIVAIAGGRNYADGGSMLLNHATDQYNQPGSSVKPFLSYALAFEYLGWSTSHTVMDQPFVYAGTDKVVQNFNKIYNGQMKLTDAVGTSMNTPALQTLQDVINSRKNGRQMVVEYLQNLGFSKVTEDKFDIGYAIGGSSFQANAVELAAAHGTMINKGNYITPHTVTRIEFDDGSSPIEPTYTETNVLSEEAAYLVSELMYEAVNGPYTNYMQILKRKYPVYGKTGTTNWGEEATKFGLEVGIAKDKWMISSTTEYTTAVWVGYEKADSENHWTSAKSKLNLPGKISSAALDALHKNITPEAVQQPSGVKSITHILGTYPYTAPLDGMSEEYITTGKIKSEYYSLVQPEDGALQNLVDFKATIDNTGKITMQWTPYPDQSKLTIAPVEMDLSIDVKGKTISATGKRLFDWTWVFGPVRYRADILVDGETVKNISSETDSAEEKITLKPGSKIKVCGYYAYETYGNSSNQVCSQEIEVADNDIILTIPSNSAKRSEIEAWATNAKLINVSYKELLVEADSALAGTNTIRLNGSEAKPLSNITIKESELEKLKVEVTFYVAKPQCPDNSTYNENTGKCECDNGYLDDGKGGCKIEQTETNQDPNCSSWDKNSNSCLVCAEGYELDAGACKLKQTGNEDN